MTTFAVETTDGTQHYEANELKMLQVDGELAEISLCLETDSESREVARLSASEVKSLKVV